MPIISQEMKVYVSLPHASAPLNEDTTFYLYTADMSGYGYPVVAEVTVTVPFNLPTKEEMVIRQVTVLRTQQIKKRAEAEREDRALQDEINKLLALTYDAPAAVGTPVPPVPADWQDVIHGEAWSCIKTGCALVVDADGTLRDTYWGDLFQDGSQPNRYLFNCANEHPDESRCDPETEYSVTVPDNCDSLQTSYAGYPRFFVWEGDDHVMSEKLGQYINA